MCRRFVYILSYSIIGSFVYLVVFHFLIISQNDEKLMVPCVLDILRQTNALYT